MEVVVIGAGAAGCFGAIRAAEAGASVVVVESGRAPLRKVKISGGGRCNVTHACFEPGQLVKNYPRGHKELRGPFHKFQPRDTIEWFKLRGVQLKTETDGRMFPVTDSSATIMNCLLGEMERLGIKIRYRTELIGINCSADTGIEVHLSDGSRIMPNACLVATGSLSQTRLSTTLSDLGHTIIEPVPSLFSFKIPGYELKDLAGASVSHATVSLPGTKMKQSGPLLITHSGLSGPAILKLSAWAARELNSCNYNFPIRVQWVPGSYEEVSHSLEQIRHEHPKKHIESFGPFSLPKRLWQRFIEIAETGNPIWSQLKAKHRDALLNLMYRQELSVQGKSTHKDEFVTCGGVCLKEVDFRTMESRRCPGLYFAGETLDIDGVTGGFNFQAAWTTGYLAGSAIAERIESLKLK